MNNHHQQQWQKQLARSYTLVTAMVLPLVTLSLFIAWVFADSAYAAYTLVYFVGASILSIVLYILARKGVLGSTCLYLMCVYLLLAFSIVCRVGIGPGSVVLCSIVIILAGSLCGYRCSLLGATASTLFLLVFRAVELHGSIHPVYVMSVRPTNFSHAILAALLFNVLAAISGSLYRLEETRRQLRETEATFAYQKNRLTDKLKRQSQKLRSAESEKMQQLYRLAEVGEASTALMHDLANNLTSLALEIDGIETKQSSRSVRRARSQIRQINDVLNRTRQHLKGQYKPRVFDVAKETTHTSNLLRTSARTAGVTLEWARPGQSERFGCLGEKVLFQQLLTNIIINAIESYRSTPEQSPPNRKIALSLKAKSGFMTLTITDWAGGIDPEVLGRIFEPFYTTKEGGMGMGLYLTKRFIEGSFAGSIKVESSDRRTTFTIALPQAHDA